jgi:hypothetical protein
MSTIECVNTSKAPLALLNGTLEGSVNMHNPVTEEMRLFVEKVKLQLKGAFAASWALPDDVKELSYPEVTFPPVFSKMKHLEAGWDGYEAAAPTAELISAAESLWSAVTEAFPNLAEPRITPGPDELIEFCWSESGDSTLVVGLYGTEHITCDMYAKVKDKTFRVKEREFKMNELLSQIYLYAHS